MPASSKQQQKFMGMVHALKKGDIKPSDVSQSVKDAAKSMSKKDAKDFASTPHKNLPRKVKQEILNKLKEYANKMGRDHLGGDDYTSSKKGGLRDFDGYDNVDYNKDMPMDEVSRGEIFKAAKKGNYPATVVVSQVRDMKSKVIKQVIVKTPAEAPATIKVLQKKYPKGDYKISLEDRTGKIIFKESVSSQALQKLNLGLKKINRKFKGASLDGKTIDIELHPGHNRDSEIYQIYDLLKKLKLDKHKTSIFNESINERMDKRQAGELIKQLGGNRFIAMTGAKNFVVGPKGAGFKIGRNSKGINYVRIDLDGRDLYNMEFIQARGGNMKVKSKEKGVYFDQLRKLFTKNTGMYTTLGEGMFSTIDQIRQDSKDVRDFVKNVFKDRDFAKMKNDKEFIKYLKSIYEGTNESKGVPQNYMSGRTSDYHTALRGKNRDYSGGTNFKKKHHGQPDIEKDDEDQETNHLSNKQTHVKSDKLKVSEGFDKVEHLSLLNQALRAMPGSQKQKEIIRKLNKVRKAGGMRPLKEQSIVEYGQRLDLSFIEDEEAKLKGTPKSKDAIDRNMDESTINEIGLFPVTNYMDGIIPASFIDTTTRQKKERLKSTLRDLKSTLNHFWKQHKIPYRIR